MPATCTEGRNGVDELKERIRRDGRNLGHGILKVDSFLTHQVDLELMQRAGQELARQFAQARATKVLTAEISGIAPAAFTALALGVPMIYARKVRPITMPAPVFEQQAPSHTKGTMVTLIVSPEFLTPSDRILIIDDFLATGQTIAALARIVAQSGATLVGIGSCIEKVFEGGSVLLQPLNVPLHSLAVIERLDGDIIVFAKESPLPAWREGDGGKV
jgi:xanthine phosphoribosyltransferase